MTRTAADMIADHDGMRDNIVRTFRSATDGQYADGMRWYSDAHTIARSLDADNVSRAAGVLAALSPRLDWKRNVLLAQRAFADGVATGCLGSSCAKATKIVQGAAPLDVLSGDKVRAFHAAILDPTDAHAVVVDRHAMSVAFGWVTSEDDTKIITRKGAYDKIADAYRDAARIVGASPSQVQAVTWVVWRETMIRTASAMRRGAGRAA